MNIIEKVKKYEGIENWEQKCLHEYLKMWSENYENNIAVVEGNYSITYPELNMHVNEMSDMLKKVGIKKDDKILVQLPNRMSFIILTFAIAAIGAIPILALPAHREAELCGIIELAKPVAYIVPRFFMGYDYIEIGHALTKKYSCLKYLFIDDELQEEKGAKNSFPHLSTLSLQLKVNNELSELISLQTAIKSKEINRPISIIPDEDIPNYTDILFLLLSGGTTGTPKLIPRTNIDYMYNARMAAQRCKLNEDSIYLAVLPIAHNFVLSCPGILGTFWAGGKVVLSKNTSPDEVLPIIEREHVTIMALVPSLVALYLEVLEWDNLNELSSLQVLQVGGAVFNANIARQVTPQIGCKLQQVFGVAEGLICFTSLDDEEEIIYTCQGQPISPEDEVKIVNENGREVAAGIYGELLTRGPYTISGYYNAPEANKLSFTSGDYYCTGDKARITEQGNIQIEGRVKEQINRAGEKIMPAEIERYLCTHEDIIEAAVVGVPDEALGNRSCAFILTDNQNIDTAFVNKHLKEIGVATYKMPDQVERVDSWPFTAVGKIDKKQLANAAIGKRNAR